MTQVLVSGGAGYIGSTICAALEDAGHQPIILDSLVNGPRAFTRGRAFVEADIADDSALRFIFRQFPNIGAAIHCAALIVVPESVRDPARYYHENVVKSLAFFSALLRHGLTRVVFSSSASVYGAGGAAGGTGGGTGSGPLGLDEEAPRQPVSPYARSKFMMEMLLEDLCRATPLRGLALRYFNPIGADPHLRCGPYLAEPEAVLGRLLATASGQQPEFRVTGTHYDTRDGTGMRDYVHVWDLAYAHVRAVERFDSVLSADVPFLPVNLGAGSGVTVRELVRAFEEVLGEPLKVRDAPARPGDVPGNYARIDRARALLGWQPRHTLAQALASALAWDKQRAAVLQMPQLISRTAHL